MFCHFFGVKNKMKLYKIKKFEDREHGQQKALSLGAGLFIFL